MRLNPFHPPTNPRSIWTFSISLFPLNLVTYQSLDWQLVTFNSIKRHHLISVDGAVFVLQWVTSEIVFGYFKYLIWRSSSVWHVFGVTFQKLRATLKYFKMVLLLMSCFSDRPTCLYFLVVNFFYRFPFFNFDIVVVNRVVVEYWFTLSLCYRCLSANLFPDA